MKERLAVLIGRINALTLRERALALFAALGVITLLWEIVLVAPLDRRHKLVVGQITGISAEITQLNRATEEAAKLGASHPNEQMRQAIESTRTELQALDQQLHALTADLINPREMSKVLEQVLTRNGGLKLVALENLEARPLLLGDDTVTQSDNAPRIYRHGIVIQLNGTYLDTLRYLRALEQLHWRFFWDKVDLSVETWPNARVTLVVYTLGLEEGVIGV